MPHQNTQRDFIKTSAAAAAASSVPYFSWSPKAFANQDANDKPNIGCIGVGSMGSGDARAHARFGNIVAVCDVDGIIDFYSKPPSLRNHACHYCKYAMQNELIDDVLTDTIHNDFA